MRKIAIQLSLLIATIIASPLALPDQERAANPSKIELIPEQLDKVRAGQTLDCSLSGTPGNAMCPAFDVNAPSTTCAAAGQPLGSFEVAGPGGIPRICIGP